MYTDRRFTQTQTSYAADDLETMKEARRYFAHVYGLLRPFVGKRVLEVGAGIGTMTTELLKTADCVSIHCPSSKETRGMIGEKEIALMKRVKAAFDPHGILNPGKIFPDG